MRTEEEIRRKMKGCGQGLFESGFYLALKWVLECPDCVHGWMTEYDSEGRKVGIECPRCKGEGEIPDKKEPEMHIVWTCPCCSLRIGGNMYKDGDCYSCMCRGYWEMRYGKWEWQEGIRPLDR